MSGFRIDPQTLDYVLPENLIAQEPLAERESARLLVLDRARGTIEHRHFSDLPAYLRPDDMLVLNTARVDNAKVVGRKPSGGKVEVIFLGPSDIPGVWTALVRPLLKERAEFFLGRAGARFTLVGRTATGECLLRPDTHDPRLIMAEEGQLPLPPYIRRSNGDARRRLDADGYQTVYSAQPGSVAAPTAGLHFSNQLLSAIENKGVEIVKVLLNVGWGTFKPIARTVAGHKMLPETYEVSAESYERLRAARAGKRRIVAVGTTCTRVLESLPVDGPAGAQRGATSIFITPGYQFKWVGALVTNLHVPRSTPIALASAFGGLENLQNAYQEAIARGYRFYSYGDGMLIQ